VKNRPKPPKLSFRFLNFEIGSVRFVSDIFLGFRTPLIVCGKNCCAINSSGTQNFISQINQIILTAITESFIGVFVLVLIKIF